MKLSHTLLICACLVFAGINFSTAVTPTPVPAPQQRVQKWEYKALEHPALNDDDGRNVTVRLLNEAGEEGWELVTNDPDKAVLGKTALLKRPKR